MEEISYVKNNNSEEIFDKFCHPEEKPRSVIIWCNVTHDREAFHRLGRYKAYEIGDYMLIHTKKRWEQVLLIRQFREFRMVNSF